MKRSLRVVAALVALTFFAAACGDDDETDTGAGTDTTETDGTDGGTATEPATPSDFLACEVTDTGGVDDRSFNETAFKGLEEAADEVGFEPKVLESESDADFAPNINAHIAAGCDLIVTVGFLLGDATEAAAKANPNVNFAIVDFAYDADYPNVRELTFATDEAAFLAGYLAAGMSETGKVGTYGGINIPTVTIFMEGFQEGIEQYNTDEDANVELLGWDSANPSGGLFTGDFEDQSKGRSTTENLLDQGADIIMPVAGPVGLGTLEAVKAGGNTAKVIWVDTDGCVSVADSCDLFLTSVMKNMDVAVHDTVTAGAEGTFEGGLYSGTLENDGVAIAPYHEFDGDVPQELKDKIEDLKDQIISGEITVGS